MVKALDVIEKGRQYNRSGSNPPLVLSFLHNEIQIKNANLFDINHFDTSICIEYIDVSTQPYVFAKRQRGTFRLHVGCANTQLTSAIFSPVSQGPGYNEWHATTKLEMTTGARNLTRIS